MDYSQMLDGWRRSTIGDEVTLQRGFDITKTEQRPGTVPVVSSGGISSFHDQAMIKGPGVVLGRKGVVGSVYYIECDYWPHDTTLWVKDFHGNHPRFVYYFFRWLAPELTGMDVGSANPTLNRNHVHPRPIDWPPILEQGAIAEILGTLDDKIELNRRMNQTLEEMARAIFKSWFIDFDPVRAKAEGRQPAGMDAETAALFPDAFEESELGPIPTGWRVELLRDVIELNPTLPLRKGTTATYLDMSNVPIQGHRAVKWVDRPYGSGSRFQNGDVLLARITPCLENGKTALVDFLKPDQTGWGSTEFIVMRAGTPVSSEWVYCLARFGDFREYAIRSMSGTSGRQRVPGEAVGRYRVAVPNAQIVERFSALTRAFFQSIRTSDEQSRTLAAIRDTLLPKLLSGELRVTGVERELAEAAV